MSICGDVYSSQRPKVREREREISIFFRGYRYTLRDQAGQQHAQGPEGQSGGGGSNLKYVKESRRFAPRAQLHYPLDSCFVRIQGKTEILLYSLPLYVRREIDSICDRDARIMAELRAVQTGAI